MPTKTIEGIISVNSRAVGFVAASEFASDIEIATHGLNTALHGDTVSVALYPRTNDAKQKGFVVHVIKRAREQFVGVLQKKGGLCFVMPDDRKMYIDFIVPKEQVIGIDTGTKVLVKLKEWSDQKKNPEAEILEVLGTQGSHEVEMHAIILEYGFSLSFPHDVEEEATRIEKSLNQEEVGRRRDCRGIPTFTIDPKDAKDFDDALSVQILSEGDIEIGVHIADVSHYVVSESALDREARARGTSVYLVDRTIPMLPLRLSNDICSLNPNEDRLTVSAIFVFSRTFEIKSRWFGKTLIHSNHRFTYDTAQDVLEKKQGAFYEELATLQRIALDLRKERIKNGSLTFEQDEVKFELDPKGKPIRVFIKEILETNKLIEEFMLLANREIAMFIYNKLKSGSGRDMAFIYRVHDVPDPDKIDELSIFLKAIGYELGSTKGMTSAKDINVLFQELEGKAEENLVKTATIRSMAKAVYSTKNVGHFGLAFKYYTHFTSPIRRYPDLLVHRILKRVTGNESIPKEEYMAYEQRAIAASEREMQAVRAERDSIKYKQIEYLREHVGEVFEGIISGVTEWGVYVEEKHTKAEGLVHITVMGDDYYTFDKRQYALIGKKKRHRYALGDVVKIKLTGADLENRTLDFLFA